MIDIVAIVLVFLLGAIVGSFVNVMVLRFGFSERTRSRSACQGCSTQLVWYELVPILSYLLLRGKCAHCQSNVSVQYPLVEAAVGLLFVASFYLFAPLNSLFDIVVLLASFFVWATFVAVVVYDLRHTLIPVPFAWALIASAVFFRTALALQAWSIDVFVDGVLGALLGLTLLGIIVLVTKGRGMGVGDIYIGVALGFLFGWWHALDVLILSFWLGAGVGLTLLVISYLSPRVSLPGFRTRLTMKSEVPFVPFLFIGALLGMFTSVSAFLLVDMLTRLFL